LLLWAYAKDAAGGNIKRKNNFEKPLNDANAHSAGLRNCGRNFCNSAINEELKKSCDKTILLNLSTGQVDSNRFLI